MKTKSSRYGSWFVTLPLGAAVLLFLYFAFIPTSHEIKTLRAELVQKQDAIVAAESLRAVIHDMENELAEGTTYVEQWDTRTPDDAGRTKVYGEIHAQIKASGARTTRFDPIEHQDYQSLAAHRIALGSTGTYPQLMRMLANLEQLPVALWVDDVRLNLEAQAGETIECEATLVVFADLSENSD